MQLLSIENIKVLGLKNSHGVYTIYICSENGRPIPIPRICGNDGNGRLYIGAAEKSTLEYRLFNFVHSMNIERKQNNHSAGVKISNNENLRTFINSNKLYFDVELTTNAKAIERIYLSEYSQIFGEVPPLNG
jgi:hypothetical protein